MTLARMHCRRLMPGDAAEFHGITLVPNADPDLRGSGLSRSRARGSVTQAQLACFGADVRSVVGGPLAVIRDDSIWMSNAPLDMRVGADTTWTRVVQVFGAADPHHAYLFANARANRMKLLVRDGIDVWLAARRLNVRNFAWGDDRLSARVTMSAKQLAALVLGLPWQRLGAARIITVL